MVWTKDDYPDSFRNLDEKTRNKALEIANSLLKTQGMDKNKAIPIALKKAKEWAENN